jgi:hypothetical protein
MSTAKNTAAQSGNAVLENIEAAFVAQMNLFKENAHSTFALLNDAALVRSAADGAAFMTKASNVAKENFERALHAPMAFMGMSQRPAKA